MPPNPNTWNDPLLRDAENFAAAAAPGALDYGPYSPLAHDPEAIWTYQYIVKPYSFPVFGSRTSSGSDAAYQAGLAGSYWYSISDAPAAALNGVIVVRSDEAQTARCSSCDFEEVRCSDRQ